LWILYGTGQPCVISPGLTLGRYDTRVSVGCRGVGIDELLPDVTGMHYRIGTAVGSWDHLGSLGEWTGMVVQRAEFGWVLLP